MFYISSFIFLLCFSRCDSAILGDWDDKERDAYRPDKGFSCSEGEEPTSQKGLSWFVDSFREKVYPFHFEGCGGDGNVYADVPTAERNLPKDSAQCEGFNMTGWPSYGATETDHVCPVDSSYLPYGEYSAICCDNRTAARYRQSLLETCPIGEILQHDVVFLDEDGEENSRETRPLRGKNCQHDFCPTTHRCVQGEFEAFCCPAPTTARPLPTTVDSLDEVVDAVEAPEGWTSGVQLLSLWTVAVVVACSLLAVFLCILCRNRRSRSPVVQKYGDNKEGVALNP